MSEEQLTPWVTSFGRDATSWNLHLDEDERDGDGSGLPGVDVIVDTFNVYVVCVQRSAGAVELAKVFNLPQPLAQLAIAADHSKSPVARHLNQTADDLALSDIANMLMTWAHLRGVESSVALASATFGLHPNRIIKAIEASYFGYLAGDRDDLTKLTIEVDGE